MKGFLIVSFAVLLAISVGIGVVGGVGSASPTPENVHACQPDRSLVCVTMRDEDHTTTVRLGQRIELSLADSGLRWSAPREVGPLLLREIGSEVVGAKYLNALYNPVRVGHTALEASAAPKCAPNQACPMYILLWRAEVAIIK